MQINRDQIRQLLRDFEFETLWIEELGWDRHREEVATEIREREGDESEYILTTIAQKRGMAVFLCPARADGSIPDYAIRRKIQREVARSVHEHLIIYTDAAETTQIWQWVKREPGRPAACREHRYGRGQSGESLIQKLETIAVSLDEEEDLTLIDVRGRIRAAFDVERVTKRFYDRFKTEHDQFLGFLEGIPDQDMERWYASVMLNRLMFIYFIQKKDFLNNDPDYLRTKLRESQVNGTDRYYTDFLCPLFFEGFAKSESERSREMGQLLGKVPYLNGGIFQRHQIEELHGERIQIADAAFEKLFKFFEDYQWHLDERPLRNDNEINPDVLGYIFEKYINQKQMGAYYTQEDITEYISKNTIIPFLFDAAHKGCRIAFEGEASIWKLLQAEPDRYIYDAVKTGVELDLPEDIAAGIHDVSKRMMWNEAAPDEYANPTEIWREVVARRDRYEAIHAKLSNGEIDDISAFITYNLDIRQFAQDVIENCEGPELLRAFWKAIAGVTILDPTCGSGAFLFAALNILEPFYEACLDRMEVFLDELEHIREKPRTERFRDFRKILEDIDRHPNHRYFILKSIIINNLYGVDIMEEAIEICKLRLFLKMVAQIENVEQMEPLPDIDFNIQAGNTLVGYTTYDEVKKAGTGKLDFNNTMQRIQENAEDVEHLFEQFRLQQTELGGVVTTDDKQALRDKLKALEDELNLYLAGEYGVELNRESAYQNWLSSHKPFHWLIEFYGILKDGGFDVIIGNPPYVEYSEVKKEYTIQGYETESCRNLYAFITERSIELLKVYGQLGVIIPVASVCTQGYLPLQSLLRNFGNLMVSSYNDRPSKLFDGLEHIRLSIILWKRSDLIPHALFTTKYNKWQAVERPNLFHSLKYLETTDLRNQFIAKLYSELETSILKKVLSQTRNIEFYTHRSGQHQIYYTRKLSGFVQILDFIPTIYDANGNKREPSELKVVRFGTGDARDVFLALLNSNLFYWFLTIHSDCRNLNKREVYSVHFDLDNASTQIVKQLQSLVEDLMRDFHRHSKMVDMIYKKLGKMAIQCIYPKFSKSIIDEIDRVLAQHYGFTDEELDFIINYDIKYRMGLGNDSN